MLLALTGVSPHGKDNGGRTALSWAAGNGHREIVE
ncbi:unnamed protein product, partial [Tuber aestivum]